VLKKLYEEMYTYKNVVYIAVKPTQKTIDNLNLYIKENLSYVTCLKMKDLHCTIIYSKKEYNGKINIDKSQKFKATFKNFNIFGSENECLVCELDSKDLKDINSKLVSKYKFISDFPDYKTHITLSVNAQSLNIDNLPPLNFDLEFENIYINELISVWKENLD
jgi:2'-5' RNA ligase